MVAEAVGLSGVAVLAEVGGEDGAAGAADLVVAALVEGADVGVREADVDLAAPRVPLQLCCRSGRVQQRNERVGHVSESLANRNFGEIRN